MSSGDYTVTYQEGLEIFKTGWAKSWLAALFLLMALVPFIADTYFIYMANITGIFAIGALGLNLLTGNGGLISLAHGGFMAVGAYASGILVAKAGLPFVIALPLSGIIAAGFGLVIGLPALRLKGLYLAMITMGFVFVVEYMINKTPALTGGGEGLMVPDLKLGPWTVNTDIEFYFLIIPILVFLCYFTKNLMRTSFGRALNAIRDRDLAAEVTGVYLAKYKVNAFVLSAFFAGVSGSLYGQYIKLISPDHFGILLSIEYIVIIIIGGLGTVLGTILGSIFINVVPEFLRLFGDVTRSSFPIFSERFGDLREGIFGLLMIIFIVFEPTGLAGIWRRVKIYWKSWPFRY